MDDGWKLVKVEPMAVRANGNGHHEIHAWKRALVEGAPELFATNQKSQEKAKEAQINHLYRHIGQLKVERDFLSERSGL